MGTLPAHAGRNPLNVGNLGIAEPQDIASAKPSLVFLGECLAG